MVLPAQQAIFTEICIGLIFICRCCGQPTAQRMIHNSLTPQYTPEIFSRNIEERPHFVMFYAPWCGHCQRLIGTFDQLASKYNDQLNGDIAVVAKVDCTKHTALCSENDVLSYPTLRFYWSNRTVQRRYKGRRDFNSLDEFVRTMAQSGPSPEVTHLVPHVHKKEFELTGDTFSQHIATGQHFIDFYAPWCGHCQILSPVWYQLRQMFENDVTVTIAKLDCTKFGTICAENSVRGYPSLIYFNGGQKVEEYQGARDLTSLASFVTSSKMRENNKNVEQTSEQIPAEREYSQLTESKPSRVTELTDTSFAPALEEAGVVLRFVLFYAPWCPHCKVLEPVFQQLAEQFHADPTTILSQLDCAKYQKICVEVGITAYPSLILFVNGKLDDRYGGQRTLNDMQTYLIAKKEAQHQITSSLHDGTTSSFVVEVKNAEFESRVSTGVTFINYFMPWCAHCKDLAPVWEELGRKYSASSKVTIASVNCQLETELCQKNEILRYPTLIIYVGGAQRKIFESQRDIDTLTNFVESILAEVHDEL